MIVMAQGAAGESEILELIAADRWRMACLRAVRGLDLPQGCIGAGFVRAAVWDHLHGFAAPTPLADVDVLYFEPGDRAPESERRHERALAAALAEVPWSAKNQARMHVRNRDPAYGSVEDAMSNWLETPTAVAVHLDEAGGLHLIAPFGTADLLAMIIRPTPKARQRMAEFRARVEAKSWLTQWPQARVIS